MSQEEKISTLKELMSLSPLFVFLAVYLLLSLFLGDFYKMPLSVAFIISAIWGITFTPKISLKKRIDVFSKGAANPDIIYMVWIFIMAGSFALNAFAKTFSKSFALSAL